MNHQNYLKTYSLLPLIFVAISMLNFSTSQNQNILKKGASLYVEQNQNLLISLNNIFTCGFYGAEGSNAYYFAIWFTNSNPRTIVWMANRDKPVNGRGSKLSLRHNGVLVLTDVDGLAVWQSNITSSTDATRAELLDTGNLVLKDSGDSVLWQTFDFPTDTLLSFQPLTKGKRLISSLRKGGYESGYFSLYFDSDNVLRMVYDGPEISSLYWPNPEPNTNVFIEGRTNFNSSRIAVFDDMGSFLSSDFLRFTASDYGLGVLRRLTIDYDGNLRLYSLNNLTGLWSTSWEAIPQKCNVRGLCGRNGICVYAPEPRCSCPPGYEMNDPSDWNGGCKAKFNRTCSNTSKSEQVKFVELPQTDFYGYDLQSILQPTTFNACRDLCLQNCNCTAFSYRLTGEGYCFTKSILFNGVQVRTFPATIYLKVPVSLQISEQSESLFNSSFTCESRNANVLLGTLYDITEEKAKWVYLYSFAGAIGAIELLIFLSGWWFLFRKHGVPAAVEDGYYLISSQFRGFSYNELKKATGNFKVELGRGGSGAVYKGVLADERAVAVKRLGGIFHGDEEFLAELSTIGRINHMNLVRMWGFCSEGRHRLLVYEYVDNLSLDTHLFTSDFLGWKERYKVALGTAKGLAYLHDECLEWVIHCDVKPENILLDSEFEPKIADFGLAKLSQRGVPNSEFSRIRGTKGYMAPEWALNLPITAKVDVYSYGVVILEMVKGIRLSNWVVDDDQVREVELTKFVRTMKSKIVNREESWLEDTVDPRLQGEFNKNQAATLVELGLACVEEDRNKRPTMDSVVQTLLQCNDETHIYIPIKL